MKYCTKCGRQLFDEAVICPGCGCPAAPVPNAYSAPNPYYAPTPYSAPNAYSAPAPQNFLLTKLSERIKTNGIIWIVIAVLQILIGLSGAWFTLIVGVLNIVSAVKDMNYSKAVLTNPNGIVSNYESLTSPIITLVYNLVIGGVIGVVGSIYYFVALRGFVMENKNAFLALETPSFSITL